MNYRLYCKYLQIIVILLTIGIAVVMAIGCSKLQKGFEFELSLPKDSFVRHFLKDQRLYFSKEGPGIQVFCSKYKMIFAYNLGGSLSSETDSHSFTTSS